jgi:hypothetical protein
MFIKSKAAEFSNFAAFFVSVERFRCSQHYELLCSRFEPYYFIRACAEEALADQLPLTLPIRIAV